MEKEVVRRSALIYLPISVGATLLFFLAASLVGGYPPVAKIGGVVWVGLLSLIVSMPIVTSRVKHYVGTVARNHE
ncbi:MAG: hypothetical protein A2Z27_03375 [candidate division Zixibacteria bacterium RBG_16_50_21]|nr:MAG: hypothetical protein A2Z27_03375 [candidate division Zixibacteria bacterium RBG_16_50_21]